MKEAMEPASVIPLQDLTVFGFLVVHQGVNVDRLIFLADAGINAGRSKE